MWPFTKKKKPTSNDVSNSASIARKKQMEVIEDINESFGDDLIVSSYIGACCADCAKYRSRIYSQFGENKTFPKLPNIHVDCGISLYPYIPGTKLTTYKNGVEIEVDPVEYSNRPFDDDRSEAEKAAYERWLAKKAAKHSR